MASSVLQLPSVSPASSPRPIPRLPDISSNDKGDPQYLQPDQSNLGFDNHLQNSNLRQSLQGLSDHGVVDVSYKNQVNTGPTRYVVNPTPAAIRLFCVYTSSVTTTSSSSCHVVVQ